jgi:phospholipid/cholesterol/gamma-HCH transport system substrate-binding protein
MSWRQGMAPWKVGLIAAVVALVAVYFGFTKSNPFANPYHFDAIFASANNVAKNSPVRIAGVNVGRVTGVHHLSGGRTGTVVTMEVQDKGLPIHSDATVKVRPRIFLEGNFFVDLNPSSPSAPTLHSGGTLPIQQASAPVQLDQVLTSLQADTRRNLQILLQEYGKAVKIGGPAYNRSARYWASAYKNSAIVNQAALGTQPHDLSGYISSAGITAQALDAHPASLKSLVTDFNTTALAFARQQGALSAAIAELPRTLTAAQPALAALNASFPAVRTLAVALRPAVRSSLPAINATIPFAVQARGLVSKPELRGLVADLRPTVPALERLTTSSLQLYPQVRLASSCTNDVLLPWTKLTIPDTHFPAKGDVASESVKWLPGVAGESRTGDANGQWFRVGAGGGPQMIGFGGGVFGTALFPIQGVQPSKPAGPPPLRPTVPCETQQVPDLSAQTSAPPPKQQTSSLSTPVQLARWQKAQDTAVNWLRSTLKLDKLPIQVLNRAATATDIANLKSLTQQLQQGGNQVTTLVNSLLAGKGATP